MVKLSRTSLGFLALTSRVAAGVGALGCLGVTCLALGAFFLGTAAGFAANFFGGLAATAALAEVLVVAAVVLTDFAGVAGAGFGARAAGAVVVLDVVMTKEFFDKRYKQFI